MTLNDFQSSLNSEFVPTNLSVQLQALWWDAKGDWKQAHDLIDYLEDLESAHIHAYLHRVEGDLWNARYWYSRAKQPEFKGALDVEWKYLVEKYL